MSKGLFILENVFIQEAWFLLPNVTIKYIATPNGKKAFHGYIWKAPLSIHTRGKRYVSYSAPCKA
ncbi:hypothetical protein EEL32_07915 [Brevibacillus laterosporus]|nr:hypothetical protein EEL32_07915 [Brevibacillus laterosporus]